MEPTTIISNLANLLRIRKEQHAQPYNLLLTSTLSLTPALLQAICAQTERSKLSADLRTMGRLDRINVLQPLLHATTYQVGYQALAELIKAGYFSAILTTNIDSALEDALTTSGLKQGEFNVFASNRDRDEYIVQALDEYGSDIRLVKLHGSLRDKAVPENYPDFFELHDSLKESVQRYLNRDMIIVGSLEYEDDIQRAFTRTGKSVVYYALSNQPARSDDVVKLISARGYTPGNHVIAGPYGDPNLFFPTLAQHLLGWQPQIPLQSQPAPDGTVPSDSGINASTGARPVHADVLLITVTETETQAVFAGLQSQLQRTYQRHEGRQKTYYDLGMINDAHVFLVQSEMGSSGPGSSLLTVIDGIEDLTPSALIMVGIAFGFDPTKQQIGDVLVSRQICDYDLQRYGTGPDGNANIIARGDRVHSSTRLLNKFRSGNKDWSGAPVDFGLIVSGDKLIDNIALRDQLHRQLPEAIGGEMEGRGLYSAAQHHKVDWIVVKAICDWADGNKAHNKKQHQEEAALNAAQFTLHVLQKTRFL